MDKEHILSEIRRTAEENGGAPLGKERFEKETGIKQSDLCGKYWSRWSDAIVDAGYTQNTMQSAYSDVFLFLKIIELIQVGSVFRNCNLKIGLFHTDYRFEKDTFPLLNVLSHGMEVC